MFQVLSISGGGFKGLYSATLLAEIEANIDSPLARHFDLLAGTSIGGILALAIAAEIPIAKAQRAFEQEGQTIFGNSPSPQGLFRMLKRAHRSPHNAGALRRTLETVFDPALTMGDLVHPLIIPAVNLSKGDTQVFKTNHHHDFWSDQALSVVDVAMATSAAPTYFPVFRMQDSLYADGGLYANAPDLMALHEATHFMGAQEEDLRMLSIGTTSSRFSFAAAESLRFGIMQWFFHDRLSRAVLACQQQSVIHMMRHRLKDRYLRLDHDLSSEQERSVGLDIATNSAQGTLKSLAHATAQNYLKHPVLTTILEHPGSTINTSIDDQGA